MKNSHRVLLAFLSAILFSIPFFQWGTGLFLLIAFVPLLLIEDEISGIKSKKGRRSYLWYWILTFYFFNLFTTYWVKHAAWVGIIAALVIGTTYMTLVFGLYSLTRRKLGNRLGYASLVVYWLAFEFLYLRAQINFPWLVLGNGFANDVMLIQWYEVTGALGGTLWVLVMNLAVFWLIKGVKASRAAITSESFGIKAVLCPNRSRLIWVLGIFLVPLVISLVRYLTYEEKEDPYEMVVLQPNIDPYLKFSGISQEEQTTYLMQILDSLVTPQTDYIIGPETFLNNSVWEDKISEHPEVLGFREFLKDYPGAKMVIGATTWKLYKDSTEFTHTSRPLRDGNYRFDSFNSAFQLDSTDHIPIYHKSMLVVGVEHMPYTRLLGFLENLTVHLGGTFRSHGTQEFRETFISPEDGTKVGPVICWESVFGEYVTDYVKEAGAHFIFIITNDGWWGDTPGHRQHNAYAHIRAIETRRSIARSANTGISSLINQKGQELSRIGWWERSGLRDTLNKNDHITFYVKHGDFIGRIAVFLTVILLLYTFLIRFFRK